MKVIVTGANGFVGSNLIKKLLENNIEVLALDVCFEPLRLPVNKLLKKEVVDYNKLDDLSNVISKGEFELLYHFAWAGVNGPNKGSCIIQAMNIDLLMKVASFCKKFDVKKILASGTIAERNVESLNHLETVSGGMIYGVAKFSARMMLESYCKSVGLNFVWMQFSNIFGPKNKTGNLVSYTMDRLMNNEPAMFGPARQPYDFIFVDDLINAIFKLGFSNTTKNFYFIGSGTPRILFEYLECIGKEMEKEDLICINSRPDDGIKYTYEMFETRDLVNEIGNYISGSFEEKLRYTISHYND